ncbi:hypothetical protein [Nocardia salmonicida]|uniref:hypothetical protein n=1 Tax=Nocardia salmonicida TaxID=53431 RepID=UPI002E2C11E2|nr:hypothetical protein [Nocardia salmonicida]
MKLLSQFIRRYLHRRRPPVQPPTLVNVLPVVRGDYPTGRYSRYQLAHLLAQGGGR